ncbi:hypothetical protein SOCE26_047890 [Sorangium cellulosum]|uniref:Carboxypeptidase regulatory-like domain-containing protein n=1 Tax=Sorangium cellulosum TaxID=56 RepID=A0A2L0EVL5_SORCE|nr:carboxypeptidase-like regulatory domain-containing protein [Sorangium cellulosum]AUX43341.1 hypothetical protein SOCE26_047890 [Sorangium cellulosum]
MTSRVLILLAALIASACDGGGGSTSGTGHAGGGGGAAGGGAGDEAAATSGGAGGEAAATSGGAGGDGAAGGAGSGGSPAGLGVTGVLTDEGGQPIGGAPVLLCNTRVCYTDSSGADGRFTFRFDAKLPVDFVVKSMEDAETAPRRGVTLFPLHFVDAVTVDAGPLFVPELPAGAVPDPSRGEPQILEVGDGLRLTARCADLLAPLGASLHDIAARRIPPERVPALPDLGGEELVAVYAMYPFGTTTSGSLIGVQAPSDLAPGTRVRFRSMSTYDGKLSAPVAGEADGAVVKTAPLSGIDELTWLVISR